MIRRPPGLELDLGGSVKGWAADSWPRNSSAMGAAPSTVAATCVWRPVAERRGRCEFAIH